MNGIDEVIDFLKIVLREGRVLKLPNELKNLPPLSFVGERQRLKVFAIS
jgi:hypothetical protein